MGEAKRQGSADGDWHPRLAAPAIAAAGPVERWRQKIACSFLVDGACGVYEQRPLACRAYFSLDAGRCERALASGSTSADHAIPVLDLPKALNAAVRHGI